MKLIVYHNCYRVCNRIYQVCNCISISFHARLHTQCLSFAQQINIFAHSKKIIAHLMLRLHTQCLVCTPNVWFAHPMFGLHTQCLVCTPNVWFAHPMFGLHTQCLVCTPNVWFAHPMFGFAHPMFGLQSLHTQCFSQYSRA